MMRITLAVIGRLKDGAERQLFTRYADRIDKAGRSVAIGPLTVLEYPEARAATADARKAEEAMRLLTACEGSNVRIALDETGKTMSSMAFADRLAGYRDNATAELSFLIGGPDGHGDAVRDADAQMLALGPMTLPHGLARIILIEQIYRAITIISGHPYHRS